MLATISLVGLPNEGQFTGSIQFDELRQLVIKTLDLDPIWELMCEHLPKGVVALPYLVRLLHGLSLRGDLPAIVCGRSVIQNSKVISATAYLLTTGKLPREVLRQLITEFTLVEKCDPNKVFRLTFSNVLHVLRSVGYAVSEKMFDLWVKQTALRRLFKDKLMLSEFLFLAANATLRSEVMRKVLPYESSIEISRRTGLFTIDKSTKSSMDPNRLIQVSLDGQFDNSRVLIDSGDRGLDYAVKRKRRIKKYLAQSETYDNDLEEFRSLLRDKELEQSTRTAVRENDARMRRRHTSLVAQAYAELRKVLASHQMRTQHSGRASSAVRPQVRKSAK